MCGRFTRKDAPRRYADKFCASINFDLVPQYNIAPGQAIHAARTGVDGARELELFRWRLVPRWSKEPTSSYGKINARAETVAAKPAFRYAWHHRCLIAVDGFYEWKQTEHGTQPYCIYLKDHEPFAFACLWEHWEGDGHEPIDSATILVTEENKAIEPIHNRMPPSPRSERFNALLLPTRDALSRGTERQEQNEHNYHADNADSQGAQCEFTHRMRFACCRCHVTHLLFSAGIRSSCCYPTMNRSGGL